MKNIYRKLNMRHYRLADLVAALNASAKNSKEAAAALADLFESGRVRLQSHGEFKRVKVGA